MERPENPEAIIEQLQAENETLREEVARYRMPKVAWGTRAMNAVLDFFNRPLDEIVLFIALAITIVDFLLRVGKMRHG